MKMKMFVTTAAIMAALTASAFAEGELQGTEALGEADGSFKMSAQQPIGSSTGQFAMAQASLPGDKGTKVSKTKRPNAKGAASHASAHKASAKETKDELYNDTGFSPELLKSPTGMDGGNRK
jgi:hypothetical protein